MAKENQDNILKVYEQAEPDELRYGLNWYHIANLEAKKLSMEFGVTVGQAAGIIAALSPNQSWLTNLNAVRTLLQAVKDGKQPGDIKIPAYGLNKLKGFQIALGAKPSKVLGGLKVRAFYQNILRPNSSLEVTVDGHAYSVWHGTRFRVTDGDNKAGQKIPNLAKMGRYDAIAEDYREVARQLGLQPWQVQAVTWVVWRRLIRTHAQDRHVRQQAYVKVLTPKHGLETATAIVDAAQEIADNRAVGVAA